MPRSGVHSGQSSRSLRSVQEFIQVSSGGHSGRLINHFSTTGRRTGPLRCDAWIRQTARPAIVTSSFKIFLIQTFQLCAATCYILPSRTMPQLFSGLNCVYRSVQVYGTLRSYLRVLVRIRNFYNDGDLARYVLDRLYDNLTDKSY